MLTGINPRSVCVLSDKSEKRMWWCRKYWPLINTTSCIERDESSRSDERSNHVKTEVYSQACSKWSPSAPVHWAVRRWLFSGSASTHQYALPAKRSTHAGSVCMHLTWENTLNECSEIPCRLIAVQNIQLGQESVVESKIRLCIYRTVVPTVCILRVARIPNHPRIRRMLGHQRAFSLRHRKLRLLANVNHTIAVTW